MKKYHFQHCVAKFTYVVVTCFLSGSYVYGQGARQHSNNIKWTVNPFDFKVFIENKGQFNNEIKDGAAVLYSAHMGMSDAYFTKSGINYRYIEVAPPEEGKDPDQDGPPKRTYHYASAEWVNTNPGVTIEAADRQSDYYTYGMDHNKTIKTDVYRKIVYHNLYPGIDVVYTFPADEGSMKKYGIEYALVVHPGADLSRVKIKYSGVESSYFDEKGDVIWKGEINNLTDHAPVAYYEGTPETTIPSTYLINGNEETFSVDSYDKSKTLVIDPWTTSPAFTTFNTAYVLDYDYAGNVYVYGGASPYQLVKINAAGTKQWTFNATTLSSTGNYIGGMCCDRKSENCYMSEGWNATGSGARTEKVNTSGFLLGTDLGNTNMDEIWRLVWDPCTHLLYGTGNGTCCPYQACQIDTSMVTETIANICTPLVTSGGYHDFGAAAIDPLGGFLYTANSQSLTVPAIYNNYLFKCPLPGLTPATYQVPDHFAIHEFSSYTFDGSQTNGFSGAAVSPNWVYLYQGDTLKQMSKTTGAINAVAKISATPYTWGGIAVDYCDNIYLGNSTAFQQYSPALALVNSTTLTGTIYDVKAYGTNGYACGTGFVTELTITAPTAPSITKTKSGSGCSACNGTAKAILNLCGTPDTAGVTYSWSTGATTDSISNLCTGTYSVTVSLGCAVILSDTVNIVSSGGSGLTVTKSQTNVKCSGGNGGVATDTASKGTPPYTYSWSTGATTSSITGLTAGSYTCTTKDSTGCTEVEIFSITQPAPLTATIAPPTNITCNGDSNGSLNANASGGTKPYTYSWNTGQTTTGITGLKVGSYTVTVTDSNGCSNTATASITQPAVLTAPINPVNVLCNGGSSGSATAVPSGGTPKYTYSWSNGETNNNATGLTAGTYSVMVTDSNGCTTTANVIITQPTALTSTMGKPINITCFGANNGSASITASGGSPNYTYSWTGGQTSTNATGLSAGSYTVTVTDNNGCTSTASVVITQPKQLKDSIVSSVQIGCSGGNTGSAIVGAKGGTGAFTYSWAPAGGTGTSATGLSAGVYTVTVTDSNGCKATVTDTLKQPPTPKPMIVGNDSVCPGGSVILTASGGGTYAWSNGATTSSITVNPTTGTTYSVTVTLSPCSADTSFKVSMYPVPKVTVSANQVICHGQNATFTAGGGGTYLWSPGGSTNATITVTPASNTTYTVTVSNGRCTKDSTVTVTVNNPPNVNVTVNPNPVCQGNPVTFTANVTGTGPYSYKWSNGATTSTITLPADSSGSYKVVVSNGCLDSASGAVTVMVPVLDACCPSTILVGDTVTIDAYNAASYVWIPSTGLSCDTCFNPIASPTVTTTYTVTGTDANGCTTEREVTVFVECVDYTVPNVFTPNDDGINDDFVPYYYINGVLHNGVGNVTAYNIIIYDRWGKEVYTSNDPTVYWNGRIMSTQNLVPDGVYFYIIKSTCGGNNTLKKGFVQVLGGK